MSPNRHPLEHLTPDEDGYVDTTGDGEGSLGPQFVTDGTATVTFTDEQEDTP